MVIFVIIINLIITLFNLYIAWKIWQFQLLLSQLRADLDSLEEPLTYVLSIAPIWLTAKKNQTKTIVINYQKLTQAIGILTKLWLLTRGLLPRKRF